MTFDYARMAGRAAGLLARFGAQGQVIRKEQSGTYNPDTGDFAATTVVQDVTCVVLPIDQKLVDGSTVLATDEQAYLSAVGLTTPKPTDKLVWQGVTYTIVRVKNLAPAGESVLCELILRR